MCQTNFSKNAFFIHRVFHFKGYPHDCTQASNLLFPSLPCYEKPREMAGETRKLG